jgi:uncharacterized protein (TIGR02118 family)
MVKVVFCLRKRDDMTRAQFFDYWHGHHAALSRQTREAMGVRRYVQNLTLDCEAGRAANEVRGGTPEYDGVAEAWFDSLDGLTRVLDTEAGRSAMEIMFADEANFIDLKRSCFFIVEEHQIY